MTEVVNATLSMLKTLKAQPLRALKSPAECPMGFMRPGCRLNRVSRAFEIKREKGALKKMFKNARHGRLDLGFGDLKAGAQKGV